MEPTPNAVQAYLKLKKGDSVSDFLNQTFGERIMNSYFSFSNSLGYPIERMFKDACKVARTCDIKEIPLYINHVSPTVRKISESRLQHGV